MSKIKANYIVNKNDDGPPELTRGAIVAPGSTFIVNGGVNISGVATATSFVGDGSGLTDIPVVTPGKVVAYKRLFSYDETLST
jgi:hypothetical protein